MLENAPTLSVVIAAHNGLPELTTCLTSLQNQQVPADVALCVEIIVAGAFPATAFQLQQTYAAVRLLRAACPVSVPHLQVVGHARGRARSSRFSKTTAPDAVVSRCLPLTRPGSWS
jgi:hypothetical protein